MADLRTLTKALARCFLAEAPSLDGMVARGSAVLGKRWRWLRPLAKRYLKRFDTGTRPHSREVVRFLIEDGGLFRARGKYALELQVDLRVTEPLVMRWPAPPIASAADLAAWLGIDLPELEWFADLKGLAYSHSDRPQLSHYHYRVLAKDSGSVRLIESPKLRLKAIQRRILAEIVEKVPPHPAVQGFVKGRSIHTFAAPHVGRRVVLRMDLQDFFPSIGAAWIQSFFRTMGYVEDVADLLAGLCTNAAPNRVWTAAASREIRALYRRPHLPQGAPASPALANICMYRADCRLAGLARSAGATYTRYADDIAFSGDAGFERRVDRFSTHAAVILHEEGFTVHHRKTRVMRQGVRQYLAGLVVNERLNVPRPDFDRLKAILTNCARLGPASQNRESHADFRAHLAGHVAFIESVNPGKGARLRKLLAAIVWDQ
jgi:RNA-directed DNA polymerase